MSTKGAIPDAWDDDWVNLADKPEPSAILPQPAVKLTKAQKRVQHQELQKQIWASAESPSRSLWLEAQGAVPLKQEMKPPTILLTRRPVAVPTDGDEDSEDEARRRREMTMEERKRQAAADREEKVRKYAEARERIMGSGPSSTSPAPASRDSSQGRDQRKLRGKPTNSNLSSRPTSAGQSPARSTPNVSGLFDPEDMGRRLGPRRDTTSSPKEREPARQPRGPDANGRAGFGFPGRGGHVST